jgi:hypothetical protein
LEQELAKSAKMHKNRRTGARLPAQEAKEAVCFDLL